MCGNRQCPKAETCFRFRAQPNEFRQAYANFAPDEEGECQNYMHIKHWSGYALQPIKKDPNEDHQSAVTEDVAPGKSLKRRTK